MIKSPAWRPDTLHGIHRYQTLYLKRDVTFLGSTISMIETRTVHRVRKRPVYITHLGDGKFTTIRHTRGST